MQSESAVRSAAAANDTRGKHRISAELKRLEQETRFLEIAEYCGNKTRSITSSVMPLFSITIEQMAQQILHGIGGLKDPKSRRVADAGFCDRHPTARVDVH
ncbi:hypothetical protein Acr_20g0006020 [Actinidia rufa]|uniref:Uncharacterized protein n=1 Tax=Actinidia rufa TaxID=165716 RepID=A0A7J0GDE6_9ERIC|nr:hypothetical protein Acr_20g0006020 [Actinidia rufa]